MNKIEELKFSISRFDHFFDSINNKGNLYLTINLFLFGGIIASYSLLLEKKVTTFCFWDLAFLIPMLIVNGIATLLALRAIKPYINKERGNSLLYFGDISSMSLPNWKSSINNLQEQEYIEDLTIQCHQLASGLTRKFKKLKTATNWLTFVMLLLIITSTYFIIKYYLNETGL